MSKKKNKRVRKITKELIKAQIFENYYKHVDKYDNLLIIREDKQVKDILQNPLDKKGVRQLKFKSTLPKDYKPSRGELTVAFHLKLNNIKFLKEVTFAGLISPTTRQPLRFDFYLPDLNICIEYDGEQHFRLVKEFDGDDITLLPKRRELDRLKTNFCKANGIKLIRIKYTEFNNINKIISNIK